MRKAFTLIELVVAIALLTMALSFSGVIFKIAIDARRTSSANAEIMRNLRALTSQLDTDFKGLQKDAPIAIRFEYDDVTGLRHDQVLFFANGDFQSVQQYDYDNSGITDLVTVAGNIARIYYGQSGFVNSKGLAMDYKNAKNLVRRQHILTADDKLIDKFPGYQAGVFNFFTPVTNDDYEYDLLSLAEWKTVPLPAYETWVMPVCFNTARPEVDMTNQGNLHMVMCQGMSNLKIQVEEWDVINNRYVWRPDEDPYGNGSQNDFASDLEYGWFFNVPDGADFSLGDVNWDYLGSGFFPRAIKFTFTLHDSKGVIQNGRQFTHIVYIGD